MNPGDGAVSVLQFFTPAAASAPTHLLNGRSSSAPADACLVRARSWLPVKLALMKHWQDLWWFMLDKQTQPEQALL